MKSITKYSLLLILTLTGSASLFGLPWQDSPKKSEKERNAETEKFLQLRYQQELQELKKKKPEPTEEQRKQELGDVLAGTVATLALDKDIKNSNAALEHIRELLQQGASTNAASSGLLGRSPASFLEALKEGKVGNFDASLIEQNKANIEKALELIKAKQSE